VFFTHLGVYQLKGPDFRQIMTEIFETLRHKLEGRGFYYRCGQWGFV